MGGGYIIDQYTSYCNSQTYDMIYFLNTSNQKE